MQMRMMTMILEKKNKNKVLLGLSGGVDSTTAALLLKEKGLEVTGYYFDVLGNNQKGKQEAQEVADQLGIELISEDVSAEFYELIIGNFCSEYVKGRTPNPCVICNPWIKFKKLIEWADKIGAYYIATGHYARITHDESDDKYYVRRAANEKKDQSYMLYRLGQEVLSRLIFPLGEFYDKDEIRDIAREKHLQNAEKKDSQEICFIDPTDNYVEYIKRTGLVSKPGKFIDKDGKVLGDHKGIVNYTIGQRKGLGIALGKPAFVTKIDCKQNTITLGDNVDLFNTEVYSKSFTFTAYDAEHYNGKKVLAKVRYAAPLAEATLEIKDGLLTAHFVEAQRAAAPGQSMVFYEDNHVIGGGFIE